MKKLIGLGLMAALLGGPPSAHALFKMEISDGSSTVTLTDGVASGVNDGLLNGLITCLNCIANTDILTSFALGGSKPALAPAEMDLNYALYTTGDLNLTIKLTDTDFTSPIGLVTFATDLAGNTNAGTSGITYQLYFDASNTEFGTTTQLFDSGYLPGPLGTNYYGEFDLDTGDGPFSLTMVITIHHGGCLIEDPCLSSGDVILSSHLNDRNIPEPSSMILLGLGIVGLRIVQRKRAAK
jgi:hypothetical protein